MFENIRADTKRVLREGKALRAIDVLYLLWKSHGLQVLMIYRFGRWLGSIRKYRFGWVIAEPLYPAYWLLSVCARKAIGINLEQSADIGAGLCIYHFGGIEVRNCSIGPRCAILQRVKLGPVDATDRGPVIGEGVYIGPHAQICADVSIGDGVTIGAGAVVTQDIPPRCLVLGNPGRIAQRDYDNSALL